MDLFKIFTEKRSLSLTDVEILDICHVDKNGIILLEVNDPDTNPMFIINAFKNITGRPTPFPIVTDGESWAVVLQQTDFRLKRKMSIAKRIMSDSRVQLFYGDKQLIERKIK